MNIFLKIEKILKYDIDGIVYKPDSINNRTF